MYFVTAKWVTSVHSCLQIFESSRLNGTLLEVSTTIFFVLLFQVQQKRAELEQALGIRGT